MTKRVLIVVKEEETGDVVETVVDSATEEAMSSVYEARKRFGSLRFSRKLKVGERLELLVDDEVELCHPNKAKAKKKTGTPKASSKSSSSKNKENATPTEPKPAAKDDPKPAAKDEAKPAAKDDPKPAAKDDPKPAAKDDPKPAAVFAPGAWAKKKEKEEAVVEETTGKEEEEEEEEWEFDDDEEEEQGQENKPKTMEDEGEKKTAFGAWNAWEEAAGAPEDGQAGGDKWNEAGEECAVVVSVKPRTAKGLARRVKAEGLAVLNSSTYCLAPDQLSKLKAACLRTYEAKLEEARSIGAVSKKRPGRLAKGQEEAVPGFNQRPGGRVDMVMDDELAPDEQPDAWPWTPVVQALLGPDAELNFVGCVVARPGDSNQNWHIDGVHDDKTTHRDPDRVIVFCPLTSLDADTGCTEMIPKSHFKSRGHTANFANVSHMPRVRHYLPAGTPLLMDYRLWHRGLKNNSPNNRLLLYTVFERASRKRKHEDTAGNLAKFIKSAN